MVHKHTKCNFARTHLPVMHVLKMMLSQHVEVCVKHAVTVFVSTCL
jgi:hypothetical protein